jgi:carbamoyltransferase
LEEFVDEYFEGHCNEYMQYVAKAKHDHKAVTHVDGTARVQVVRKDSTSALRPILEAYYEVTKIPMLLNTSLNIKGQPMVNTWEDAKLFEKRYGVKVF